MTRSFIGKLYLKYIILSIYIFVSYKTYTSFNFNIFLNNICFFSIFLAFINADTTCVYYQINEGLLQPKAITSKHLVRNSQNIRDSLIRKNKDLIEQSASYGIPITLKLDPGDDESTDHRKDV